MVFPVGIASLALGVGFSYFSQMQQTRAIESDIRRRRGFDEEQKTLKQAELKRQKDLLTAQKILATTVGQQTRRNKTTTGL